MHAPTLLKKPTCLISLLALACVSAWVAPVQGEELFNELEPLLAAYTEANGGEEMIENIRSLRISGTIESESESVDFLLLKKRPDLKRLTLISPTHTVEMGYDGKRVWRRISRQGHASIVEEMSADDAHDFIRDLDFDGPLVGPPVEGVKVALRGIERIDRVNHYVVELQNAELTQRIYLDARTLRDIKVITLRDEEAFPEGDLISINRNHRRFSGLWIATEVERRVGDRVVSVMRVSNVEMNPGLFNSIFEMPEAPVAP